MSTVAVPSWARLLPLEDSMEMRHLMLLARRFDEAVIDLYASRRFPRLVTSTSGRRLWRWAPAPPWRRGLHHQHSPRPRPLHRQRRGPAADDGRAIRQG